jgi:6-phosphogluconolactonase
MTRYLYVGTSTQTGKENRAEGIFIYRMDPSSARLEKLHAVESGPNPSFLAFHPSKRFLFSVNESMDGAVSSFAVDPANGNLTFLSRVKVAGDLPCYLSVDPSGRFLLVANYWTATITVIPIGEDGILGERV